MDIFKISPGQPPIWVDEEDSMLACRARLTELMKTKPARYFLVDLQDGNRILGGVTPGRPEFHTDVDSSDLCLFQFGWDESNQGDRK